MIEEMHRPAHSLVPTGVTFFPVASENTSRYAFLLLPGFTLLAFSSALDPLRVANQVSQRPLYQWRVLSVVGQPVISSSGVSVNTDTDFSALDRKTTLVVCAGNPGGSEPDSRTLARIARHYQFGGTVIGICTGAVALARVGILAGRRFTLHWENQPAFREKFPDLEPTPNKFEIDGRVLTCGGGAAATDLMLSIIASEHRDDFAGVVSEMCLRRVVSGEDARQRSSLGALLQTRNPSFIAVVKKMKENLEDPLSLEDLARLAGYSRRNLERLFKRTLGQTPAKFYQQLRLDYGRSLLSDTDLSLSEVAAATGFKCVSHFAKTFRVRFGCSPSKYGYRCTRTQIL